MGDISEHFSREEHACRCGCGFDAVDVELNRELEAVREHFGKPVSITGPNRCYLHNCGTVGAARSSQHVRGKAADIRVEDTDPEDVADWLEARNPDRYGIGRYCDRVHLDVRARKARWRE